MGGVGLSIFFTAGMANLGQLPFLCTIPHTIYLRQRKSGFRCGCLRGVYWALLCGLAPSPTSSTLGWGQFFLCE